MDDKIKNTSKPGVAYYHLPGLFEFYGLYRMFLPLFYHHREYFYNWCAIGSIYGALGDCIWGGGRTSFGVHHLQQAKSRLWELGLNIGKISFDEGINLLNQREARVYLQTPSAGSRARLGAKVDLKLTLDAAKVTAQSAAADKEMIKAAEELRRLDAETADSLARVRLDSLANRPVEAEPVIDDGLFPDEETAEDEFFQ